MAILSTELNAYRAAVHSDAATNGGRLTNTEIVSGVKNNVWPDVPQADLTAGVTASYRKIFLKVDNAENIALQNAQAYIENFTPGEDRVLLFPGTATDIQSDISSPRLYGCGALVNADITAGVTTSIDVTTEVDGGDGIFQDGDTIRISDKADINAGTGTAEFATISGTPTYTGSIATITLAAAVTSSYTVANGTRVSSVLPSTTVGATHTTPSVDVGTGTVDDTNNPIIDANIGSVDDGWTLEFTSTQNYTITRDNPNPGDVAHSGTTVTPATPQNSDTGTIYFTIPVLFWNGSWAQNDRVTFTTTSATLPVWEKRVIPPGTESLTANSVKLVLQGESAS